MSRLDFDEEINKTQGMHLVVTDRSDFVKQPLIFFMEIQFQITTLSEATLADLNYFNALDKIYAQILLLQEIHCCL